MPAELRLLKQVNPRQIKTMHSLGFKLEMIKSRICEWRLVCNWNIIYRIQRGSNVHLPYLVDNIFTNGKIVGENYIRADNWRLINRLGLSLPHFTKPV